jgi:4-amino-4-deoxy-L-arabinose transferase-like glycosyltransferase
LIKEQAHPYSIGNKLTGYFYAMVFKTFGFLSWNQLILFSVILNAITLLIFSLLVFYLFDFRTSLVFSLIYIFIPFIWAQTQMPGAYELTFFFVALFFLFYFLGIRKEQKRRLFFFILSGLFLALTCLARETFFLLIPIIFVYLLLKKEKQAIIFIFVPVFAAIFIFYLPDFLANHNSYLQLFPVTKTSEELRFGNFTSSYDVFYPDPYTYHFDKDNFLKEYTKRRASQSLIFSIYLQRGAVNVGADQFPFGRRILLNLLLSVGHAGRLISWEDLGGPLILSLILFGLYFLKKERPPLFWLFVCIISGIIFLLSFVFLLARNHSMDFGWILALLAALGLLSLVSMIETYFKLDKKRTFWLFVFILIMVLYNLLLASHTYWGRIYDNKENLMIMDYASKIDKLNIFDKDVIAMGTGGVLGATALNYLKDKSIVVFQPGTARKLLENRELNAVFKKFGVTYILSYPDELSKKILKATNVVNISSFNADSADNAEEDIFLNWNAKNWLMNFVR